MNLLASSLDKTQTESWLRKEKSRLEGLLLTDDWKSEFQGKIIFSRLCGEVLKADSIRIRECYVDIALKENPEILKDIIDIFKRMK